MPKKKHGGKDKRIHAVNRATGRPLCGAKSSKVSSTPKAIDCEPCGKAAVAIIREMVAEGEHARQEAALAQNQPNRWWQVDEVLHTPKETEES